MNKTELSKALAEEMEVPVADAKAFLAAFESVVVRTVRKGEPVLLTGFCKFLRKDMPARKARNPQTGETIKVKAKKVVRITPLKAFKDSVLAVKK